MLNKYRSSFSFLAAVFLRNAIFLFATKHILVGLPVYPFSIISSPRRHSIFDLKRNEPKAAAARKVEKSNEWKKVCDDHKILSFNARRKKTKHIILDFRKNRYYIGETFPFPPLRFGGNLIRRHFATKFNTIISGLFYLC